VSPLGPVTDAERRGWQIRAHQLLGDLLTLDLPPAHWQIGAFGDLIARAAATDPAQQRAAFDAWVDHLGARRWPERDDYGITHLRAVAHRYRGVDITIVADVPNPAED